MSMIAVFRIVDDATVREWLAAGDAVDSDRVRGELDAGGADNLDIDKSWHGLHFLLTGDAEETDDALGFLLGGRAVGEDIGYGPARVFDADEVRKIAAALAPIDAAELRRRFDPEEMAEADIYPDIWDADSDDDDALGYLIESYEPLKALVARAAQSGRGLVTALM